MTPRALIELCMEQIHAWNTGEIFSDAPQVLLTLDRPKVPTGKTILLYGRSGPRGRIATCKQNQSQWQVTAYFSASEVLQDLVRELGIEIEIPKLKASKVEQHALSSQP